MSDGIVNEKKEISSTQYLYGCEIKELPIDVPYEIEKHKAQIVKGKALAERLGDRASEIRRRIMKVNESVNWNQLMLDNLLKGK